MLALGDGRHLPHHRHGDQLQDRPVHDADQDQGEDEGRRTKVFKIASYHHSYLFQGCITFTPSNGRLDVGKEIN